VSAVGGWRAGDRIYQAPADRRLRVQQDPGQRQVERSPPADPARGMLTVPPAPGIRPMDTSGSRNVVPGRATTRPAKAASSMPAHGPTRMSGTLS
jgi:hypothetical protein